MLYSRLAMRLRSLAIILPDTDTYTITRLHICNHIHPITIYIGTQPEAGVHAHTGYGSLDFHNLYRYWLPGLSVHIYQVVTIQTIL